MEDTCQLNDSFDLDESVVSLLPFKVPTTDIPTIQLFEKIHRLNQSQRSASMRKYLAFVTCVASIELN